MSKILLINPPTIDTSPNMPLNLAYLAAVLEKNDHQVKCIDYFAPYNFDDAFKIIDEYQPDIVGVTLRIDNILEKYKFIRKLKNKYPKALYVAGGSHASCLPEEVIKYSQADVVIVGEGEDTFVDIANKINLKDIPGCFYQDEKGNIINTGPRELIHDLDAIPFPAYQHFPLSNYTKTNNPNFSRLFWSLFTSRGCPHNCIFCVSRNVFDRRYRYRSAENVFQEIRMLYEKYGARHIAIQDDEPLIRKERMYELCEKLIKYNKKDLTFSARCRITSVDSKILNTMKMAGFNFIAFGIESGDDETLKNIKKYYTLPQIIKGFKEIAKSDLRDISIGILAGFPWENSKNFESNIKLFKSIPDSINYSFGVGTLIPYPKTELYEKYYKIYNFKDWWLKPPAIKENKIDQTFFNKYTMSINLLHTYNRQFWNFSFLQKRKLLGLAKKLEYIKLKRKYKHPLLLFSFSLTSYYLYRISPKLERIIFNKKVNYERLFFILMIGYILALVAYVLGQPSCIDRPICSG
ncbi:MAG: radical SAM protein [Patescibacteria group bacterium]